MGTRNKRTTAVDPGKRFRDTLRRLSSGKHQLWQVFADWCAFTACTFYSSVCADAELTERRVVIAERYTREDIEGFDVMLESVVEALTKHPERDFLGAQFMELELSSHWKGQFFTPGPVAQLMGAMVLDKGEIAEQVERYGFFLLNDPAVGAGIMPIAAAAAVRKTGFDPQQHLHVTCNDVDSTAVAMCYIQLTLLGIPAVVWLGNSLTMEHRETWLTPAHVVGRWDERLALRRTVGKMRDALERLFPEAEQAA